MQHHAKNKMRWTSSGDDTAPDGRHAALSDDLCICKYDLLPKLVASQQSMSVNGP
jgi:hypothetical protein